MTPPAYLAFDLGASGGRAFLGTLEGELLSLEEIRRFGNNPVLANGTLYWDLLALWRELLEALKDCRRRGLERLAGIATDTWGVDFGLLGSDGRLLGNPICYRDRQTEGAEERIRETLSDDAFYGITGMTISRIGTLPQLLAMRKRGVVLEAARTLLWMPDLLRFLMSGTVSTEPTIAGSSLLTSAAERDYSARLLELFGLPRSLLPPIAHGSTVAGPLLPEVREETGLLDAPVLVVAGHDTLCAAASAPFADASTAFLSSGTWSVIGTSRRGPILSREAREGGFQNELGVEGLILVRNLMGFYLLEGMRRQWEAAGETSGWGELVPMARAARAFPALLDLEDDAFFAPGDPERCLRDYLRATGQDAALGRGELVRAYLEGLALMYRRALDQLELLTGEPLRRICLVGGGSRNPLYCEMVAAATGREVLAGPAEATAAGNVGLQCLATGRLGSTGEIRALIRLSFAPTPYAPRSPEAWKDAYGRYQELVARRRT